jgi:putative SOS response-associated peptidase YedK
MCGRYTLFAKAEAIRALFEVPAFDERLVVPRYNIAPTQPIAVVRQTRRGRELLPMRWGLIPGFVKDAKDASLLIIARAESIGEKPSFRHAFRRRRCLIPASGFYEWEARGNRKQPYAVLPRQGDLVAFAGIFETWCGADGSEIDTAAVVTVPANGTLGRIHHRMPAVIAPEDFETWLSEQTFPEVAHALLSPAPEELLSAVPISTRVNAVANDDPGLLEQVEPAAAPANPAPEPLQGSLF